MDPLAFPMSPAKPEPVVVDARRNRKVAFMALSGVCFMLAASFAAVPLYDLFCRTTGYGGTTMVAKDAPAQVSTRAFTIRFDANVAAGLNWRFEPEVETIAIKAGEVKTVGYRVRNLNAYENVGIASYNVAPEVTGAYFNKIACFCFTELTMKPGEVRDEQVVFFIDPEISKEKALDHIETITLSYTFFPAKTGGKPLADAGITTSLRAQARLETSPRAPARNETTR